MRKYVIQHVDMGSVLSAVQEIIFGAARRRQRSKQQRFYNIEVSNEIVMSIASKENLFKESLAISIALDLFGFHVVTIYAYV